MQYSSLYEGHIDGVSFGMCTGWCRSLNTPNPVHLLVYINGVSKAKVIANKPRRDLKSKDIGDHAFEVDVSPFDLERGDEIKIIIDGTSSEIQGSPFVYKKYTETEPWIESDLYSEFRRDPDRLTSKHLQYADEYHHDGFTIIENLITPEECDAIVNDTNQEFERNNNQRIQDAWKTTNSVKDLVLNEEVLAVIEFLYERKAVPFQTLNFKYGTQQATHSDSIHFSCLPARFMCGVWVALEDITTENGAVVYYPKSHKMKEYTFNDMGIVIEDKKHSYKNYEKYIARLVDSKGFEERELTIKKGDCLIWSSNLLHAGGEIKSKNATRWSQVTHYYFEGCLYYTPMFSNEVLGKYALREIENIRSGKIMEHTFNGRPLDIKEIGNNQARFNFGSEAS